jgi:deazaflavin-dependent oxidoreductase (nitroreductase family)
VIPPDEDFCYLTTAGRVTGRPHRIEIWYAVSPGRNTIYLLAGGRDHSDWVRNLAQARKCTVEIAATTYAGTGRILPPGADEDKLARDLVHDKYAQGDELAAWRAEALPVAIELRAE